MSYIQILSHPPESDQSNNILYAAHYEASHYAIFSPAPVTSCFLDTNMLLSILPTHTLNLCSSLTVTFHTQPQACLQFYNSLKQI
jgi:hypothetical protein